MNPGWWGLFAFVLAGVYLGGVYLMIERIKTVASAVFLASAWTMIFMTVNDWAWGKVP